MARQSLDDGRSTVQDSTLGVVLAGGTGSRLLPLTRAVNKHLLPVHGETMLYWPLRALALAGVTRAVVVLGGRSCGEVVEQFGSVFAAADAPDRRVDLAYVYQHGAGGIGAALAVTMPLVEATGARRVVVVLGDNVFPAGLPPLFMAASNGAAVVGCDVERAAERYGCVEVHDSPGAGEPHGEPVEKPCREPRRGFRWLALAGAYSLPADRHGTGDYYTLPQRLDRLVASARGELEVTDLLASYRAEGRLSVVRATGPWADAGDPDGYAAVNAHDFWQAP